LLSTIFSSSIRHIYTSARRNPNKNLCCYEHTNYRNVVYMF
jgi:hypothetical protein